jgi:hypothetical protein
MAGLVGNIALGGSKRRCDGMPSLLSPAEPEAGSPSGERSPAPEGQRFESSQLHHQPNEIIEKFC